jgi:hypothetical protein
LIRNLTIKNYPLIILDFYKAFDKVPHKKLLRKLDNYSIRGKHWISAFLKNRQQRVVLDGEVSSQMPVVSGVPQESFLGFTTTIRPTL